MDDVQHIDIPDYEIIRELGQGAMATVYLARHKRLQRQVALKVMAAQLTANRTFRERFQREGVYVAQLEHPNIITIFDIGVHEHFYYMAMRYVAGGKTLKDKIAPNGVSPEEALVITRQIAGALECAHSHPRKIVHRDVKPANILFDEKGNAILSDFGIAKSTSDTDEFAVAGQPAEELTVAGHAVGTPAYMSPEQILGRAVDPRSDLYSLGVVLFEMLTGHKPFRADETIALAMKQVNDPIPDLPSACAHLQPIINKLMAKVPDQRFASAGELRNAIDALSIDTDHTRVIEADQVTAPTDRSWPYWLLAGATILGSVGLWMHFNREAVCVPPVLTAQQHAAVNTLMNNAELNLDIGRLISPIASNAAAGYSHVLEFDPCNSGARLGLQNVVTQLAAQINLELSNGADGIRRTELLTQVKAGVEFAPKSPALNELLETLSSD